MPTPEPGSPGVSGLSGSSGLIRPGGTAGPVGRGGPAAFLDTAFTGVAVAVLVTGAAVAAASGPWALAGVLLAAQVALGWAWVRALGASPGTTVLVAGSALAGDLAVLWPFGGRDGGHGYDDNGIGTVAGVVGVSLAVTVLYQLGRRVHAGAAAPATAATQAAAGSGRVAPAAERVSRDMAAALGGVTVAGFLTGFLVLRAEAGADHAPDTMVIAGLLGAGTAVLVGRVALAFLEHAAATLPDTPRLRLGALVAALLGAAAGAGAGAIFGALTELGAPVAVALAGAGAVAAACAVPAGPAPLAGSGLSARLAVVAAALLGVLLPLALAAPMVYLVGRQLPG
ncbi:hypothetical protein [Frankia sp. EI5c]|uniref:hypothetical protein n=1 Tax=Frankia sp. EI5c TaxID=683316 RepID=UPI001F5B9A3F|nr:hypothetical protein [Frankia sp. EI5c]